MQFPERFTDVAQVEDELSRPSPEVVQALQQAPGDILVLGVGGKMGPTLARMAKRADPKRRVIGVARFTEPGLREDLEQHGIECITADLLQREAIAVLPDAPNVIFMAGRKFGSTGSEWLTWAMNGYVPALVAERFTQSRIVAFSTACVYPFADVRGPGSPESEPPTAPPGEYAYSCVARERMLEHFSHLHKVPGRLLRLSYAIDMRYGVLHDVAQSIVRREPIDLAIGHANVIWQRDANDWTLRTLAHCDTPTSPLNISGPKIAIRDVAKRLGERLGIEPILQGTEGARAWLVDCSEAVRLFGPAPTPLDRMLDWTADWVQRGGASHNKPTHYESKDGKY
jgi:nucleoside-diphosphate-sugar epimerase